MDDTRSEKKNTQRFVKVVRYLVLNVLRGHCDVKHKVKTYSHEKERETNQLEEDLEASPNMCLSGRWFHRKHRRHLGCYQTPSRDDKSSQDQASYELLAGRKHWAGEWGVLLIFLIGALGQDIICTGTMPLSAPSILFDGLTETAEDVEQSSGKVNRGQTYSEWYPRIYAQRRASH